jgi:SPX domain protein involved in polyphosphate accumulation
VINGNTNRYKLRLRYYDEDPAAPVFFEIKRRAGTAILKERGAVKREFVASLLEGQFPESHHLISSNPKQLAALQNFCRLMQQNRATPKAHVSYLREAWMSPADNSVRVTFDREVRIDPQFESVITTRMEKPVLPWGAQVILELKFTARFPDWFREMVRWHEAVQCGVAKYAEGVTALGEERLNPLYYHPERADLLERFIRQHRKPRRGKELAPDDKALIWKTS